MKKRLIAVFMVIFFLFPTTAFAFDTNNYSSDIRIGLENMTAPSITVTMLGNYTMGSDVYYSGTSFVLNFDNNKINMNGALYDQITFVPSSKDDLIKLKNGAKEYNFKGTMTFKINGENIIPINTVNIEDYLKGVVSYEMSNSYPIEALKAQAVAARNYAILNRGKHEGRGYDLCDSTDCQVYRGYNSAYLNVIRAVDETSGILLLYNDDIVACYYSASNGGFTESSANVWNKGLPYLPAQRDDFDSAMWPTGDKSMTTAEVSNVLVSKGYLLPSDKFVKIDTDTITYYQSGRVSNITIIYNDANGALHSKSFSKDSARYFLNLPSSLYTLTYDQSIDTYNFSGRGYGHGIGLSQIGSKNRANAGQTYDQILNFYYPGSMIKSVTSRIKDIAKSKDTVLLGDNITLSAAMDGQAYGNQLFKYIVEKSGNTVFVRDYDYNTQIEYKPIQSGNYTVRLYVKDSLSKNEFDEESMTSFNVYQMPTISEITLNPKQAIINKPVTVTANINGGSPSGYDVNYEVLRDRNVVLSSTGGNTFTFTPNSYGQFTLNIKVRDKTSAKIFDQEKTINIDVQKQQVQEPSRGNTPSFSIKRTLKLGLSGSDVSLLQNALGKLGYYTYGKTTTYFGSYTKAAVVNFQKKNGISATGVVNTSTASAINKVLVRKAQVVQSKPATASASGTAVSQKPIDNSAVATVFKLTRNLKKGVTGSDVKQLQDILRKLGYFKDKSTGFYGNATQAAVIGFQRANKISQTGIVSTMTVAAVNKILKG